MTQLGCLGALRATRNAREHNLRGWSERPREQRTQRLTDDQQRVVVAQEHSLFSRSGLPRKIQRRRLMSLEHRAVVGKSHTGYSHRCRVRAARSVGHCSHCCAGLMAILLVIGVMDLRAMAVVAAAITVERLAPAGERVARAIGAVVVGAGLVLIARAAGLG